MRRLLLLLLVMCWPVMAPAQQLGLVHSPILTIESDRLFSDSAFGQRVAREIEAQSAVLAAENRRIEAELTQEEKDLTARRPEMEAAAFRILADAFDTKVQAIRREREAKARELGRMQEASRTLFLNTARPILESLMREAGAAVILERSSVFLSANVSDITNLAISRIDSALGEGPENLPNAGPQSGPETPGTTPGSPTEGSE